MKRFLLLPMIFIGMACHTPSEPINAHDGTIVDFKDSVSRAEIMAIASEHGLTLRPNSVAFMTDKVTITSEGIDASIRGYLMDSGLVESVENNTIIFLSPLESPPGWGDSGERGNTYTPTHTDKNFPNDPLYLEGKQWNFEMLGMPAVWEADRKLGDGVIVAVLDTGLSDGKHKTKRVPDLAQTCILEGYSFVDDNTDAYDKHSHGTHVSGTIAQSTNNGIGVTGLAPQVCILPIKVLSDEGSGSLADIADGIYFATEAGAHVINLSLGSSEPSPLLAKALAFAVEHNVFVACAAGNRSRAAVDYPAGHLGCHAVSAVNKKGELAWYSSYGESSEGQKVFLTAPGGDVRDSIEGGIWQDTVDSEDVNKHGYFPFQGTSMASPHVAGVAALIISNIGVDKYKLGDVEAILMETATDKDDESRFGAGLVNANEATLRAIEHNHNKAWLFGSLLLGLLAVGGTIVIKINRK